MYTASYLFVFLQSFFFEIFIRSLSGFRIFVIYHVSRFPKFPSLVLQGGLNLQAKPEIYACQSRIIVVNMKYAILSSSVVERSAVNRLVASSSLAWGVQFLSNLADFSNLADRC
jgi:hypothetical protein